MQEAIRISVRSGGAQVLWRFKAQWRYEKWKKTTTVKGPIAAKLRPWFAHSLLFVSIGRQFTCAIARVTPPAQYHPSIAAEPG